MANAFYAKGINAFALAGVNFSSDTIKASLVSTGYTPDLANDQYYNAISGGSIIAAGVALTSKTTAAGTCSAANVLWTAVTGSAASYVVIYKDTGTSSTSPLLVLIDTATGLPVTPNGGDITCAWASGNVFTLCAGLSDHEKSLVQQFLDWFKSLWDQAMGTGELIPAPTLSVA